MIEIKVNEDGRAAVQALCDVALKASGIANLGAVNQILTAVVLTEPAEKDEDENDEDENDEE